MDYRKISLRKSLKSSLLVLDKVTLPLRLYDFLDSRARRFGLTMSAYIKHLILDDVKDDEVPTYPMSPATEMTAFNTLEEHRRGKTKRIDR